MGCILTEAFAKFIVGLTRSRPNRSSSGCKNTDTCFLLEKFYWRSCSQNFCWRNFTGEVLLEELYWRCGLLDKRRSSTEETLLQKLYCEECSIGHPGWDAASASWLGPPKDCKPFFRCPDLSVNYFLEVCVHLTSQGCSTTWTSRRQSRAKPRWQSQWWLRRKWRQSRSARGRDSANFFLHL